MGGPALGPDRHAGAPDLLGLTPPAAARGDRDAANEVQAAVPRPAAEPEHPPFTLVGAVVGENDAIAVFVDRTNQQIHSLASGR